MNLNLRFVATLSVPGFWLGCAREVRKGMCINGDDSAWVRDQQKIARYEGIADALHAGVPLCEIPAFQHWAASIRVRPVGAPDVLAVVRQ